MKREEVIAERYGLALTRIREIPDESICKETYRDYFTKWMRLVLTCFAGLCC